MGYLKKAAVVASTVITLGASQAEALPITFDFSDEFASAGGPVSTLCDNVVPVCINTNTGSLSEFNGFIGTGIEGANINLLLDPNQSIFSGINFGDIETLTFASQVDATSNGLNGTTNTTFSATPGVPGILDGSTLGPNIISSTFIPGEGGGFLVKKATASFTDAVSTIPLPATLPMMLGALGTFALYRRQQNRGPAQP